MIEEVAENSSISDEEEIGKSLREVKVQSRWEKCVGTAGGEKGEGDGGKFI